MPTRTLRLNYPPSLLHTPIINELIRRFDLTVNILQANITLEEGWIEIEATGSGQFLDEAAAWLVENGLSVETLDS